MKQLILMVFVATSFVCAQLELGLSDLGHFSKRETECIYTYHLNATKLTEYLKMPYMPEDDADFNKFMECTWKQEGHIDNKGNIKWDTVKTYIKNVYIDAVGMPELADFFANDTVTYCKSVTGNSPGQITVRLLNCIVRRLYS